MRAAVICAALAALLLSSCATDGPPAIGTYLPYGACCVPYGDGRQPGVAIVVPTGTPVIAPADGTVIAIGENTRFGGYFVRLTHGGTFDTYYTHLSRVLVANGRELRRGELIGMSGADYTRREYLHFGICRTGGSCLQFADSSDPDKYWMGGSLRCFDPAADYSAVPREQLTVPLVCGEHARRLRP
jgi:hypothetical protein